VAGYKLDECDNSDFTRNWSFPEISRFPSGADGEQMHCFFGRRYQETIQSVFDRRKQPTYGLVRSSHALAAPYPYVLYSDLYDHREFIRALVNSGFCGLLWCPEVRDAKSAEDLIRRLQTVVFSPLAMVNAWYIKDPPWKAFGPDTENICRDIINLRMKLVPYLMETFQRYHDVGMPPFRALVLDYPDDPATWTIDNQYMMGTDLLVAPVVAGESERDIYLPEGEWVDFFTGAKLFGKQKLHVSVPLARIPVFVKSGAKLPLARPTLHSEDPAAKTIDWMRV
jgi:alpha-D-xyloside xylohydrolase